MTLISGKLFVQHRKQSAKKILRQYSSKADISTLRLQLLKNRYEKYKPEYEAAFAKQQKLEQDNKAQSAPIQHKPRAYDGPGF